jgi:GNAT superfamily N-acetyltransferase
MLKNFFYWISINHIARIRTYGLVSHIRYMFNFNISNTVVNMQMDLSNIPELVIPSGYSVREMDTSDPNEIISWLNIINNSYSDVAENEVRFKQHLLHHPFLNVEKIFFIIKSEIAVGTITVGRYRKNPAYGGPARIAVLPVEQGKGLGFLALNYALHYLKRNGVEKAESVISFKRTKSIITHFQCGFRPQFNRNKVIFDIQKRMFPVRLLIRYKINNLLRKN